MVEPEPEVGGVQLQDEKKGQPEPKKAKRCCGTCGLWNLFYVKKSDGTVPRGSRAPCMWVLPEMKTPSALQGKIIPSLSFMGSSEGSTCACWVARTEEVDAK